MNESREAGEVGLLSGLFDLNQFIRSARQVHLGLGLALIGGFHLGIFACCEFLFARGDRSASHFLPLWFLDGAFAFAVLRTRLLLMSKDDPSPYTQLILRILITFLILCLTSASLNSITGFEIDWFKISWAMLGTFAFAMLGWIFHLGFLVPAVFMSVTALLIAAHPDHAYGIFGIAWFLLLQVFAVLLETRWLSRAGGVASRRPEPIVLTHRAHKI